MSGMQPPPPGGAAAAATASAAAASAAALASSRSSTRSGTAAEERRSRSTTADNVDEADEEEDEAPAVHHHLTADPKHTRAINDCGRAKTRTTKGRITDLGSSHHSAVNIASLASNTRSQQPLRTWRPSAPLNTLAAPLAPIADRHHSGHRGYVEPADQFQYTCETAAVYLCRSPTFAPFLSWFFCPRRPPWLSRFRRCVVRHRDYLLVQ